MSIEQLNSEMELEEVVVKSDGTSETKNMIDDPSLNPSSLRRRLRGISRERFLLFGIFLVVIIILILLIYMFVGLYHSGGIWNYNKLVNSINAKNPCVSVACLEASVSILHSLNTSIDPCIDFKQFACGKWERDIILPAGSSKFSVFEQISDDLLRVQRTLIDTFNVKTGSLSERKMIEFYKSCLDTSRINRRGVQPFLDSLDRLFGRYGGWELLKSNQGKFSIDKWSYKDIVENVRVDLPFTQFEVHDDFKDNRSIQLFIYPSNLLIDKTLLERENIDSILKEFKKYMKAATSFFDLIDFNATKMFDDIINLEIKLAKTHPDSVELRNIVKNYHPTTIEQLNTDICSIFDWSKILDIRSLKGDGKGSLKIILTAPEQLKESCHIIREYLSTTKKKSVLHNYIIMRLLHFSISLLSDDIQRSKNELNKYLYGVIGKKPRWQYCVINTNTYMPDVIGNMYINKKFKKESKPQVIEMINLLKEQFEENLKKNTWMDKETIKNAIYKVNKMVPFIGYTDDILNITSNDEYYKDVEINNTMFFENVVHLLDKRAIYTYTKAGYPKKNTTIKPLNVNAFYDPARNEILFPAGILQPPFFDPGVPRSLKYAGIGTAISHELTHGFDDVGSKFGPYGNIHNWWSELTKKIYVEKSTCFVNQYSEYKIENQNINGNLTLGENIADNGGVRLAFKVYKNLQEIYGDEPPLAGLSFSHDQLFFITFARLWCNVETKASMQMSIKNDPHSPNKYRIIGVLSNMKEFANAFNCPIGSPMNPSKKCLVW